MKCMLCGSTSSHIFHKGTRDNPDIDVWKCADCGLMFLSDIPETTYELYSNGAMHINGYDETTDSYTNIDLKKWKVLSQRDDKRRFEELKELCKEKSVLDFGCGNGGFLRLMEKTAKKVVGVEWEREAREELNRDGIRCVTNLSELEETYDVIVSFNVIEHLTEPHLYLQQIFHSLNLGGGICM